MCMDYAQIEIELGKARSRMTQLESEKQSLDNSNKRFRDKYEKKVKKITNYAQI